MMKTNCVPAIPWPGGSLNISATRISISDEELVERVAIKHGYRSVVVESTTIRRVSVSIYPLITCWGTNNTVTPSEHGSLGLCAKSGSIQRWKPSAMGVGSRGNAAIINVFVQWQTIYNEEEACGRGWRRFELFNLLLGLCRRGARPRALGV